MCALHRPPETLRTLADGDTAQQSDDATWLAELENLWALRQYVIDWDLSVVCLCRVPDMLIQCIGPLGKPVWLCDKAFYGYINALKLFKRPTIPRQIWWNFTYYRQMLERDQHVIHSSR